MRAGACTLANTLQERVNDVLLSFTDKNTHARWGLIKRELIAISFVENRIDLTIKNHLNVRNGVSYLNSSAQIPSENVYTSVSDNFSTGACPRFRGSQCTIRASHISIRDSRKHEPRWLVQWIGMEFCHRTQSNDWFFFLQ